MIKIDDVNTNLLFGDKKNAKLWEEYVDKFIKKMRERFSLSKEEGEKIKKRMTDKEDPLLKLAIKNYKEMFSDKSNSNAAVGGGAKKKSRRRKKKKRANKTKKRYQMGGNGDELVGFLTIIVGIMGVAFSLTTIGQWLGLVDDPTQRTYEATYARRRVNAADRRRPHYRRVAVSDRERARRLAQREMSYPFAGTAHTYEQPPQDQSSYWPQDQSRYW